MDVDELLRGRLSVDLVVPLASDIIITCCEGGFDKSMTTEGNVGSTSGSMVTEEMPGPLCILSSIE